MIDGYNASLLRTGALLCGGRYIIDRYLSSGGFGNTYIARDRQLGEEVVIKELFVRGINERDLRDSSVRISNADNYQTFGELFDKFKNEANRQASVRHHHVVRVYNFFEQYNTAYLVMEYVRGDSLYRRIKYDKMFLTTPQVWKLLDQMTLALGAVHEKRIFHLDIKPANVMIDLEGDVKLIDFGASKQQNFSEKTSISVAHTVMCFTPGYAPSEQVQRVWKSIGPWTDLYSLGGTVYAGVTGNKPPESGVIFEEHERAFDFSNIDPLLADIILWLMQPSRSDRPQNVAQLRNALLRAGVISPNGIYGPEASLLPIAHEYYPDDDDMTGVIDISPSVPSDRVVLINPTNKGEAIKDDDKTDTKENNKETNQPIQEQKPEKPIESEPAENHENLIPEPLGYIKVIPESESGNNTPSPRQEQKAAIQPETQPEIQKQPEQPKKTEPQTNKVEPTPVVNVIGSIAAELNSRERTKEQTANVKTASTGNVADNDNLTDGNKNVVMDAVEVNLKRKQKKQKPATEDANATQYYKDSTGQHSSTGTQSTQQQNVYQPVQPMQPAQQVQPAQHRQATPYSWQQQPQQRQPYQQQAVRSHAPADGRYGQPANNRQSVVRTNHNTNGRNAQTKKKPMSLTKLVIICFVISGIAFATVFSGIQLYNSSNRSNAVVTDTISTSTDSVGVNDSINKINANNNLYNNNRRNNGYNRTRKR